MRTRDNGERWGRGSSSGGCCSKATAIPVWPFNLPVHGRDMFSVKWSRSKLCQHLWCQCPNVDDEIRCPDTGQCTRTDTQDTGSNKTDWQFPDCTVKKG